MEPTRSTLTLQFWPAGSSATTATNCLITTLSWNLPDLPTLFVPPGAQNGQKGSPKGLSAVPTTTALLLIALLPLIHGLGRLAALATLFVFLGPKTVKKGHQRVCQQYLLLPLLLLLLIALLPRFDGTYQIYLDRAVWAGWKLWRPFLFLLGPKTVKKGHQRVCQQYLLLPLLLLLHNAFMEPTRFTLTVQFWPAGSSATTATNCLITTLSWNLPDLPTLFVPPGAQNGQKGSPKGLSAVPTTTALLLIALLPLIHGLGRLAALATLFVFLGPKTVKKGHQRVCQQYLLLPLLLLLLIALLQRFHGTYQIYLDRAVWAGWKLWRPFLFLLGPKTVKKGHQSVCQQYLLLPLLLLLLLRFHGTYQINLDRAIWAGWQLCYYCD